MATAAKTRTRTRSSSKRAGTGTKAATKSATKRATKATKTRDDAAKRNAAKKAEADQARAKAREAAAKAKADERAKLIKSGDLIEGDGVEFARSVSEEDGVVLSKAKDIIDALKASDVPVRKRDIAEPNIMSVGIFATLKGLGLIEEFRARTGERGGSGVAYLWVGKR